MPSSLRHSTQSSRVRDPHYRQPGAGPRANAIMERWIGGCRRELLDRTLIWHLLNVLRQYETHHNEHRPHRSIGQAAPLRPLPETVTGLDTFRIRRRDLIGGVITNTRRSVDTDGVSGTHRLADRFHGRTAGPVFQRLGDGDGRRPHRSVTGRQ